MMTKGITWENVGQHYTSNGVLIEKGLQVLDYNYRKTTVVRPCATRNPAEDQWFVTANNGIFDGSRLVAIGN